MDELYPMAGMIVKNHFYVDDILAGANTLEQAKELRRQVTLLCQNAGLTLGKFRSNNEELLRGIPEELREDVKTLDIPMDPTMQNKALRIHWDTRQDTLHISVLTISTDTTPTKRLVVSAAAKVLDLMG